LYDEKYKKIFTWEVTTSGSASDKIVQNELKTENVTIIHSNAAALRPTYIFVGIMDRSLGNAILYVVYRIVMLVNNSFWYYFAPFVFNQAAFFYLTSKKSIILKLAK